MPRPTSIRSEPRTVWVGAPLETLASTWRHSLTDHCPVSQSRIDNVSSPPVSMSRDFIPSLPFHQYPSYRIFLLWMRRPETSMTAT